MTSKWEGGEDIIERAVGNRGLKGPFAPPHVRLRSSRPVPRAPASASAGPGVRVRGPWGP